ncbi:hypothetical protein [Haliangium ochraceum]|uniref:Uncharacterized protein n=1 Tax=Haliangium ochraceum (strain DSM 14365 / JCM 11303 / SMP-2) TaxID=502025 RepID=D0LL39_HALO1|nr:hypothetical protein [Haliangium ochraceum]ACY18535.1 hypothetical protein Hoch_6060 [Haliangium ochraceum DSM 14365]
MSWVQTWTQRAVWGGVMGAAGLLAACAKSSNLPPGFTEGTSWTAPVVGAIGEGEPIVPVHIAGQGPYLFVIDANEPSSIDPRLQRQLGLAPAPDPASAPTPSAAAQNPARAGDIVIARQIALGTLTVNSVPLHVRHVRSNYHGRPVHGSIGRELLPGSLVWTVDRDRQRLLLSTPAAFSPPSEAQRALVRSVVRDDGDARQPLVVEAALDGDTAATMQMSFHGSAKIRADLAARAGLREVGPGAWVSESVRIGELASDGLLLAALDGGIRSRATPPSADAASAPDGASAANGASAPGNDDAAAEAAAAPANPAERQNAKEAEKTKATAPAGPDYDGVLGQDFWSRFVISVHLDQNALWLTPRPPDDEELRSERLGRWAALFDGCDTPACVTVEEDLATTADAEIAAEADSTARGKRDKRGKRGKHGAHADERGDKAGDEPARAAERDPGIPEGTRVLRVRRPDDKRALGYDVLLRALDERERPLPAPHLLVAFPEGGTETTIDIGALTSAYQRASSFEVVDASPFAPPCRKRLGCAWLQR